MRRPGVGNRNVTCLDHSAKVGIFTASDLGRGLVMVVAEAIARTAALAAAVSGV